MCYFNRFAQKSADDIIMRKNASQWSRQRQHIYQYRHKAHRFGPSSQIIVDKTKHAKYQQRACLAGSRWYCAVSKHLHMYLSITPLSKPFRNDYEVRMCLCASNRTFDATNVDNYRDVGTARTAQSVTLQPKSHSVIHAVTCVRELFLIFVASNNENISSFRYSTQIVRTNRW